MASPQKSRISWNLYSSWFDFTNIKVVMWNWFPLLGWMNCAAAVLPSETGVINCAWEGVTWISQRGNKIRFCICLTLTYLKLEFLTKGTASKEWTLCLWKAWKENSNISLLFKGFSQLPATSVYINSFLRDFFEIWFGYPSWSASVGTQRILVKFSRV